MPARTGPDPKLHVLAARVAAGASLSAASRALGISERRGRQIAADPRFRAEVERIRRGVSDRTVDRLAGAGLKAIDALVKLLKSESESTRLKAADAILTHSLKAREALELAAKIQDIEQRLNPGSNPWAGT